MSERDERDALDRRPTPEAMLARFRAEAGTGRGRLRVYLGMAPGVGKTYRMLEEGHRRVDRGTDLVVGYVEPHGRPRTAALLDGLEIVPRRRVEYRGVVVEEMDTDAVIARRPTVVLIDELAHTNVPGSEREKRWEDVELVRDAGIHVVSTMNIQHLESMAEAVETITGAPVHERLPDEVLAGADEIELVDMSPHALRQRMKHGNVYPPERARIALERFFTEANLTALRDLSLRVAARQVEEQLEELVEAQAIPGRRPVSDRVAVVIDGSDAGREAVRRAADLAALLHCELVAMLVETGSDTSADGVTSRTIREDTEHAVDLGARVIRIAGTTPDDIITSIKGQGASHVVVPHRPTSRLERFRGASLAERLVEASPGVEVHLVGPRASR
jgi:two-component system sensor histidine kinase KdpD